VNSEGISEPRLTRPGYMYVVSRWRSNSTLEKARA